MSFSTVFNSFARILWFTFITFETTTSFAALSHIDQHILYQPSTPKSPKTLVVAIHGCFQNADDFMQSTQLNTHAEKHGFYALYPNQEKGRNPMNCWNWYEPKNQKPMAGETKTLMGLIEKVKAEHAIERTWMMGLSSGGAMASILISCHPNSFDGVMIHSGISYAMADQGDRALKILELGPNPLTKRTFFCDPSKYQGKIMIVHGLKDTVVHPKNKDAIAKDFIPQTRAKKESIKAENGIYAHEVTTFFDDDQQKRAQIYLIPELAHALSGGDASGSFSDPKGPPVVQKALELFGN